MYLQRVALMTYATNRTFAVAASAVLLLLAGCPPRSESQAAPSGVFVASANKLYDRGDGFDLRDRVIYPAVKGEGLESADTNVMNRQLTMYRCMWCHECGFQQAFDVGQYGQPGWAPRYKGEQWRPVVDRMAAKDDSMLNEVLAERVYTFLRDSTLGIYDESKDTRGAVVVAAPAEHGAPTGKDNGGKDSASAPGAPAGSTQ